MTKKIFLFVLLLSVLCGCTISKKMAPQNIQVHAIRLKPGQDLRQEIEKYVKENSIQAGWINTCAGSLTHYNIRFANAENGSTGNGHFEIVSLTGTLSTNGCHIHLSISDSTGRTIGGHLLAGCTIYTTAEIILQSSNDLNFKRAKDGTTPWDELQIEKIKP